MEEGGGGWGVGVDTASALAHAGLRCFSLARACSEVSGEADGSGAGWVGVTEHTLRALAGGARSHAWQICPCGECTQQSSQHRGRDASHGTRLFTHRIHPRDLSRFFIDPRLSAGRPSGSP